MAYSRERREYLKKRKRCLKCGKQDSNTLLGRNLCFECEEKNRASTRSYNSRNREKRNATEKERYEKRKASGVCAKCGKRKPKLDRLFCETCLSKARQRGAEKRRNKGIVSKDVKITLGLCLYCNAPVVEGYCFCEKCLLIRKKNMEHANKSKPKIRLDYLFK